MKNNKYLFVFILLFTISFISYPSHAVPDTVLDEIKVISTKIEGSVKLNECNVRIITQQDLQEGNYQTVSDALQDVSGVFVKNYGYFNSLTTISLNGVSSENVLVCIDDIPINSLSLGTADLSKIPISSVARIEIIQGNISALYGGNASDGLINIFTKDDFGEGLTDTKDLQLTGGSYNTYNLSFNIRNSISEVLNFNLGSTVNRSDGNRKNSSQEKNYNYLGLGFNNKKLELKYRFSYLYDELGTPGPMMNSGDFQEDKFEYDNVFLPFDFQKDHERIHFIKLKLPVGDYDLLKVNLYHKNICNFFHSEFFAPTNSESMENETGLSTSYDKYFGIFHFTLGLDGRNLRYRSSSKELVLMSKTEWEEKGNQYGVYFKASTQLGFLVINPGIRYEEHFITGSQTIPFIGIIYEISDYSQVKLQYSDIYRTPTFNELFYPGSGNQELKPETGQGVNLVYLISVGDFDLDLSIYGKDIKDRIVWLPTDTSLWFWEPVNINKSKIYGANFVVRYALSDLIKATLDYSFITGKQYNNELVSVFPELVYEEMENDLYFVPENKINLNLHFFPISCYDFGVNLHYETKKLNVYPDMFSSWPEVIYLEKYLPQFLTVDMDMNLHIKNNISFFVRIDNLTDMYYKSQFGYSMYDYDYPAAGRTYWFGVKIR